MFPLMFVLLLGDNALPQATGAIIRVEDRHLLLPPLPRSGLDARQHGKDVQSDLKAAQTTVEQYLADLGPPLQAPDERFLVPADQAVLAQALATQLQNEPFAPLLGALIQELKAWDEATRRPAQLSGAAAEEQRKGGTAVLDHVPIRPGTEAGSTPIDDTSPKTSFGHRSQQSSGNSTVETIGAADASVGGEIWNRDRVESQRIQAPFLRAEVSRRGQKLAQEDYQALVARSHEAGVSRRWTAVVQELEAEARVVALLTEERPETAIPAILELQRRVKLQLVVRYQAALKLCGSLWTKLGSKPEAIVLDH
jgi:hypothetical protein